MKAFSLNHTTIIRKPLDSFDLKGWLIGIPAFFSDVYFRLFSVSR
jgi:hypothetical protein